MKRLIILFFAATLSLQVPTAAFSSETTQNYVRCIEKNISGADQEVFIRWMISAIATHPSISDIITISKTQLRNADIAVARLFTELLTKKCKTEFRAAFLDPKNKGTNPTETAFGRLGEMSMLYIMGDKTVNQNLQSFTAFLDQQAIIGALGK